MRTVLVLSVLLLAACSSSGESLGADRPRDELVVEIDRGDGSPPERYTLRCDGTPTGDHPDPEAACRDLAALEDPFAPLPTDLICTEVYGGPQTALVTGTWRGEPVDLRVARRNGCEITQWDSLGALLPGPVRVQEGQ